MRLEGSGLAVGSPRTAPRAPTPGGWSQQVAGVDPVDLGEAGEQVERRVGRGPLDPAELLDRNADRLGGPLLRPAPPLPRLAGVGPERSAEPRSGTDGHRGEMLGGVLSLKKYMTGSIMPIEVGGEG